jgi:hypothetical protein
MKRANVTSAVGGLVAEDITNPSTEREYAQIRSVLVRQTEHLAGIVDRARAVTIFHKGNSTDQDTLPHSYNIEREVEADFGMVQQIRVAMGVQHNLMEELNVYITSIESL